MTQWLPRRVRGIETEYGLSLTLLSDDPAARPRRVGPDEAARLLFRPVTTTTATTNVFLRNGGRLYLDVGSHPEYATAECDSILDLVAHDRAGDAIMSQLADRCVEQLAADGSSARVQLHKNNLDSHGNSYGSHENYQVSRDTPLRDHAAALTPFLVVRQLLCGAGVWVRARDGRPGGFWLSQRAAHMWDPLSSTTTRSRPMINTRDEPHADPQRFRRLHVIVGDSTLSQSTLLLRLGATELVLRAIEAGERFTDLALADPPAAIREVAQGRSGRAVVVLDTGAELSALDLLARIRDRVAHCADDPTLADALARWDQVVEALADDRLELIDTRIDWAVKWRLLRRYAERHDLSDDDPRLAQVDLAFSDIRPGQGLFTRLEQAGEVERLLDDEVVAHAVDHPPSTTRAALRGRLITAAQRHRRSHTVDWMTFSVRDLTDGTVVMPDPLRAEDERVEALIERMADEPRLPTSSAFTGLPARFDRRDGGR
ncbi:Pup--protein ligase [Aestuariimicrobium ganziense]|uniref:Pup--protein ligase n=1 Tax=Aestuariimicrobium ganziense TaxID=2773677 RepID=UPI002E293F19|nr:Pup--protein ligase [Aestuariimicrobium ganziense]